MRRLAFLLALAVPAAAQAQPAPPAAADWSQRTVRTAEGGYLMGNPDAPKKLVEYGSVTCSHCADFAAAAAAPLREQIRSGRVSFEYRPFVIFPSDPGLFMLLGCQGPDGFFATLDALYATQSLWVARIQAKEAELQRLPGWEQGVPAVVRASGLDQLFRERGLSERQVDQCLTDTAAFNTLMAGNSAAQSLGVDGTPAFLLNGRLLDVNDWPSIAALLAQS